MNVSALSKASMVEAVIISGPRKGEFVHVDLDSSSATPEIEAAVGVLTELAGQISANLAAATAEANAVREELRGGKGTSRGAT